MDRILVRTIDEPRGEIEPKTGLRFRFDTRSGVVGASIAGNAVSLSPAFLTVFGIAMVPIAEEFGWPRSLVAGAMALSILKSAALALGTGWLLDRYGPRRVLISAMSLYILAICAFAFAPPKVALFYALFGVVCVLAAPLTSTTYAKSIAGWFNHGRGAAMGIAAGVGTGIGSAALPIVSGYMVIQFGWRSAFLASAAIIAFLVFPLILAFFRDPPSPGSSISPAVNDKLGIGRSENDFTLKEALFTRTFWALVASIGLCAGCMTAMFTQVVPVLQSSGFVLPQAVTVVSVFAIVCTVAQALIGFLVDRISRPAVMVPFYLLGTLGLWLTHNGESFPMMLLAGCLMGVSLGAEYSALPLMLSRYFGVRHFGKIAALVYAGVAVLIGLVPVGMNAVYDQTGSYDRALGIIEAAMLLATALILFIPSYDRPLRRKPA